MFGGLFSTDSAKNTTNITPNTTANTSAASANTNIQDKPTLEQKKLDMLKNIGKLQANNKDIQLTQTLNMSSDYEVMCKEYELQLKNIKNKNKTIKIKAQEANNLTLTNNLINLNSLTNLEILTAPIASNITGKYRVIYSDKTYIGDIKDGQLHGFGQMNLIKTGYSYSGEFKYNIFVKGEYVTPSHIYRGKFSFDLCLQDNNGVIIDLNKKTTFKGNVYQDKPIYNKKHTLTYNLTDKDIKFYDYNLTDKDISISTKFGDGILYGNTRFNGLCTYKKLNKSSIERWSGIFSNNTFIKGEFTSDNKTYQGCFNFEFNPHKLNKNNFLKNLTCDNCIVTDDKEKVISVNNYKDGVLVNTIIRMPFEYTQDNLKNMSIQDILTMCEVIKDYYEKNKDDILVFKAESLTKSNNYTGFAKIVDTREECKNNYFIGYMYNGRCHGPGILYRDKNMYTRFSLVTGIQNKGVLFKGKTVVDECVQTGYFKFYSDSHVEILDGPSGKHEDLKFNVTFEGDFKDNKLVCGSNETNKLSRAYLTKDSPVCFINNMSAICKAGENQVDFSSVNKYIKTVKFRSLCVSEDKLLINNITEINFDDNLTLSSDNKLDCIKGVLTGGKMMLDLNNSNFRNFFNFRDNCNTIITNISCFIDDWSALQLYMYLYLNFNIDIKSVFFIKLYEYQQSGLEFLRYIKDKDNRQDLINDYKLTLTQIATLESLIFL